MFQTFVYVLALHVFKIVTYLDVRCVKCVSRVD